MLLLLCRSLRPLLNDFKCSYSLSSSYLYIHASLALFLSPSFTVWPSVPHSRRPFPMSPNASVPAYFSFISGYSRRFLPCCQFLSPLFTLLPSLASSPSPLPHLCFQMPPSPVIVFFFSSAFPPYSDYFVLALLFLSPLFPFLSSRPIRLQPFNCFSKYFHIYSPFFPAFSVPAIPCLPPLIYSSAPPRCSV